MSRARASDEDESVKRPVSALRKLRLGETEKTEKSDQSEQSEKSSWNSSESNSNQTGESASSELLDSDSVQSSSSVTTAHSISQSAEVLLPPTEIETKFKLEDVILGRGASGIVRLARRLADNNKQVALKFIRKSACKPGSRELVNLEREIELLHRVGFGHGVIELYSVTETRTDIVLEMEYCSGGLLISKVAAMETLFSETAARALIQRLLEIIAYLHGLGILHRDIKLENLLLLGHELTPDNIRLADFGIARSTEPGELAKTFAGSLGYMAPEVFDAVNGISGYTWRADIWSVGVVAYSLLSGYLPFSPSAVGPKDVLFPRSVWTDVSRLARRFLLLCLAKNPQERPSAEQLLQHPWFTHSKGARHLPTKLNLLKQGGWPKVYLSQEIRPGHRRQAH